MDLELNGILMWVIVGILVVKVLQWCGGDLKQLGLSKEGFRTMDFVNYDHYIPNANHFRNYYRVGYELSKPVGWKPELNYNHLRPETNECPDCFPEDRYAGNTLLATHTGLASGWEE